MSARVVRYAVVGAGSTAQRSVLPAFVRATRARLRTIVSGDAARGRELGARYLLARTWSYAEYEALLASGAVDAVYIDAPVAMRREHAVRAARAGVHVLCEKPMAATERDCVAIIDAAREARVKLMVADCLRFDPANVGAKDTVESGVIGELRSLTSSVARGLPRDADRDRDADPCAGPTFDAALECVSTARRLFRDEPVGVMAIQASVDECLPRSAADETTAVVLRFPRGRVATFVCSHGGARTSHLRLVGTRGELLVERAYCAEGERVHRLTVGDRSRERRFPMRDPFAGQLDHFAECVLEDRAPAASGEQGLAEVRVLRALARSARTQRFERLGPDAHEACATRSFRFPSRLLAATDEAIGVRYSLASAIWAGCS
jgi:predicted dehydrogenase